jgi:RNA polymerase sigma-70 factor (ECF subfamily)
VTVDPQSTLAEQFERSRPHLQSVAYRMLGSVSEADDAVQETWLRMTRSDTTEVENLTGWLTTVTSRICLDLLRSRRARREEPLEGWLPEPVVVLEDGAAADPEHAALMADSVALALLVVLETLSPPERLAFVLHDMFAVPFEEISPIVERSVEATRQLASRARRRVRSGATEVEPRSVADERRQRAVLDAFLAASREGDFDALVSVLDPDVRFRADRGRARGVAAGVPAELRGAEPVAGAILERGSRFAHLARPARINGELGFVVARRDRVVSVVAMTVSGDRITEIDLIVNPEKLRGVPLQAP